jgi:hypothetical protein
LDALKLRKPYQKSVQIEKDPKFVDYDSLGDLLELDQASLDHKDSDGKALSSIRILGVGKRKCWQRG